MMVESEAQELSEDIMLGAVMFGHREMQHADQRHHPPGGKGGEGAARLVRSSTTPMRDKEVRGLGREDCARRFDPGQVRAPRRARRREEEVRWSIRRRRRRQVPASVYSGLLHEVEAEIVRERAGHQEARRRPRPHDRAPDRGGSRHPAAHPWFGAVHPRRNPGAGGLHPGHRRGRAVRRQPGRHRQADLHAALQLPSLLGRRNRPHGRTRPPRNRPWQAGLARHPSDAAEDGGVPLHHPRGVRDHRIQRLVLDGHGVRHLAGADGCGRSAQAADRGHRHGPDPGRQALCRAVGHPG